MTNVYNRVRITIDSDQTNLDMVVGFVKSYAKRYGLVDDGIDTAVSEAFNNACIHAYDKRDQRVTIKMFDMNHQFIKVIVSDTGKGISDVKRAMEPLYSSVEQMSGMGFTIMDSFADRIKVSSRPGKGTTVSMWFRIKK